MTPEMLGDRRAWLDLQEAILEQHRSLRVIVEWARETARAVLRGDELSVVVLPYVVLGLDRAFQVQFGREEALALPALEHDPAAGPAVAEHLRAQHARIREALTVLTRGGAQQAVTVARRLCELTSAALADLSEQDETLWSAGTWRARSLQIGLS